MFKCTADFI